MRACDRVSSAVCMRFGWSQSIRGSDGLDIPQIRDPDLGNVRGPCITAGGDGVETPLPFTECFSTVGWAGVHGGIGFRT